jgi:hypothetical protein
MIRRELDHILVQSDDTMSLKAKQKQILLLSLCKLWDICYNNSYKSIEKNRIYGRFQ